MELGFSHFFLEDDVTISMRMRPNAIADQWIDGVQVLRGSSLSANSGLVQRSAGVASRGMRIAYLDEVIIFEEISAPLSVSNGVQRYRYPLLHGSNADRSHSQVKRFANYGRTEEDVLRLLFTVKYSAVPRKDADPCSICLQEYEIGEEVAALTCSHRFHARCIAKWLTRSNACPMCKNMALPLPP